MYVEITRRRWNFRCPRLYFCVTTRQAWGYFCIALILAAYISALHWCVRHVCREADYSNGLSSRVWFDQKYHWPGCYDQLVCLTYRRCSNKIHCPSCELDWPAWLNSWWWMYFENACKFDCLLSSCESVPYELNEIKCHYLLLCCIWPIEMWSF